MGVVEVELGVELLTGREPAICVAHAWHSMHCQLPEPIFGDELEDGQECIHQCFAVKFDKVSGGFTHKG